MTHRPRHIDEGVFGRWVIGFWKPSGAPARTALIVATVVNFAVFTAASKWFAIPLLPGFDGSILHQPSPAAAFLIVAIMLLLTTLIGTVVAGAVRFEAGLFASTLAMAAISERCGTTQTVLLQYGGNESVYVRLTVELLVFWAIIAALWLMLWRMGKANLVRAMYWPEASEEKSDSTPLMSGLTAAAAQVIATGVILGLLCKSEAKNQALVSVGLASAFGAMLAHKYSPARPSVWFWCGPFVVGLIGYIMAASGQDSSLAIGSPTGFFAALARPLPIDYASMGPAGAIIGYWTVHKRMPAA